MIVARFGWQTKTYDTANPSSALVSHVVGSAVKVLRAAGPTVRDANTNTIGGSARLYLSPDIL